MHRGMSELEFELELDNEDAYGEAASANDEVSDGEISEGELEASGLSDNEDAAFSEFERDEGEFEGFEGELIEPDVRGYATRFNELALREFESPIELENEINQLLGEMEQDYFFGKIGKLASRAGRGLIKRGIAYAKSRIPIGSVIEGVTALARGNLKGALASAARAAMGGLSNHPAFAAIMPALGAIGFKPGGKGGSGSWGKFAQLGKAAFQNLASELTETANQPAEAARVAGRAYEIALNQVKRGGPARRVGGAPNGGRVRVIHLRPGERILIKA